MPQVLVRPDQAGVAEKAVSMLAEDVAAAIELRGRAVWVAAGGSTPAAAYRILADRYATGVGWAEVTIAMGDERCVPLDDPDSNWGQLAKLLLDGLPDRGPNLLAPRTELSAEVAASDYQSRLAILDPLPSGRPRLDHVWIGIGEDGHTLSLFPGRLAELGSTELVVAVHDSPKPPPDRISLTLTALKGAVHCVVLATGAGKREVVRRALADDASLPVVAATHAVESAGGAVTWVMDEAAAGVSA
jgi:6-phosphogluconolactonase